MKTVTLNNGSTIVINHIQAVVLVPFKIIEGKQHNAAVVIYASTMCFNDTFENDDLATKKYNEILEAIKECN